MTLTLSKSDIVQEVANATEMRNSEAEKAVKAVFNAIGVALKDGNEVRLIGFGTFKIARRPASQGRNPRTGEKIDIAASNSVRFGMAKQLKEAVNLPAVPERRVPRRA